MVDLVNVDNALCDGVIVGSMPIGSKWIGDHSKKILGCKAGVHLQSCETDERCVTQVKQLYWHHSIKGIVSNGLVFRFDDLPDNLRIRESAIPDFLGDVDIFNIECIETNHIEGNKSHNMEI